MMLYNITFQVQVDRVKIGNRFSGEMSSGHSSNMQHATMSLSGVFIKTLVFTIVIAMMCDMCSPHI